MYGWDTLVLLKHLLEPGLKKLEDFVDWLLLLHAVASKSSRNEWDDVASSLDVHPQTLPRIARRNAGFGLRPHDLARKPDVDVGLIAVPRSAIPQRETIELRRERFAVAVATPGLRISASLRLT